MTAGVLPGGVAGRKIEKTCIKPVYAYTTKRGMPIQACICLYNRMGKVLSASNGREVRWRLAALFLRSEPGMWAVYFRLAGIGVLGAVP